jgi:hypothetical protein
VRGVTPILLTAMLAAGAASAQDPPGRDELAQIRAVAEARDAAEALALRRRWRLHFGLGVAAATAFDVVESDREVRFDGGFAGVLSGTLTRGITELFDVFARVELTAPQRASVLPGSARRDVAAVPCAGSRRFELPQGAGGIASLDVGLRLRTLDARSRFFVGFGLRVAARWNMVDGPWRVYCDALDGTRTLITQGSVDASTVVPDLGASLETGYQFGATRAWEVGLRLSVGGIAGGDITAQIGQWYLAWSPW